MVHAKEVAAARAPDAEAERLSRGRMGSRQADRAVERRARPVRRRPHRADPAARPHARARSARWSSSTATASSCSRPIPSACAQTLDTGIVPRNTWNADAAADSRSPRSRAIEARGATVHLRPRRRAMGTACARAPTPMTERVRHRARPKNHRRADQAHRGSAPAHRARQLCDDRQVDARAACRVPPQRPGACAHPFDRLHGRAQRRPASSRCSPRRISPARSSRCWRPRA